MIPQSDAKSIMGKPIDGQPPDQHTVKYDAASGKVLWVEIGSGPKGDPGTPGLAAWNPQGAWTDGVTYAVNDGVTRGGSSFRCYVEHVASSGNAPIYDPETDTITNGAAYWQLMSGRGLVGPAGVDPGPAGADAWAFLGEWADASTYVENDGVTRGGSSFRCYSGHVASSGNAPAYDPDTDAITNGETYWELVAGRGLTGAAGAAGTNGTDGVDGTMWSWQGAWTLSVNYSEYDGVENDGASYIATADHSATALNEPGTGADWADVWDVVASKGDTGATGPQGPSGQAWTWQGPWSESSVSYVEYDGVENDGAAYICTSAHTSGSTTEPGVGADWATVWDLVVEGVAGPAGPEGPAGPAGDPGAHVIVQATAGENLAAYDVVYADGADSGKLKKADKDASGTADAIAIVLEEILDDASGDTTFGPALLTNVAWSWTPMGTLYLSGTAGQMTQTLPTSGYVKPLGHAVTATSIWWFPEIGWDAVGGSGTGDVSGPVSSTDNAIARYHLTTGKIIQDSLVTVDDAGSINIPTGETYDINGSPHTHGDISADVSQIENTLIMIAWDIYSQDMAFDDIYVDDFTDQTGVDTVNSTGTYNSGGSYYTSEALTGQTVDVTTSQQACGTWADVNSVAVTQTTPGDKTVSAIYHAVSFDGGTTYKVYKSSAWTTVAFNNGGTWQYNNAGTLTNASTNSLAGAMTQSTAQAAYQWTKTNIEAMADADWNASGGWSTSTMTIDWTYTLVNGELWDVSNASTTTCVPDMTGASSPSGLASASTTYSTYYAWQAFDQNASTLWITTTIPCSLTYDFGSGVSKVVNKYSHVVRSDSNINHPKTFTLFGSNNGSDWTSLDSQTNITVPAAGGEWTSSTLANRTAYRYYQLYVSAVNGGAECGVAEFKLMEATYSTATPTFTKATFNHDTEALDMDLRTLGWEASANDPTSAYCVLDVEPVDSITLDTDLKAWVSINDGTNYEQFDLEAAPFREIGDHDYVRGDLSGITARTDKTIRLKVTSHNSKSLKLHGIGMGVKY